MSEPDLISVIVPCYNAERTLERTLASISRQTYRHIEILIVDDGSTDGSVGLAKAFIARDSRAKLISQKNAGVAAARNAGLAVARGAFVAPIDADDLWAPEKLELQLQRFTDPKVGLVYAWFENIDLEDRIFSGGFRFSFEGDVFAHLCDVDFVGNGSNAMMRTALVRDVGGYDSGLRAKGSEGCEDWSLWLALAERCEFAVVSRPLTGYRIYRGNMSSRNSRMIASAELVAEAVARRYPELRARLAAHLTSRELHGLLRCVRHGQWGEARVMLGWLSHQSMRAIAGQALEIAGHALGELPDKVRRRLQLVGGRERTPFTTT